MKIAIIQTHLPYIDRRALSQAWFSALHLANGSNGEGRVRLRRAGAVAAKAIDVAHVRGRTERRNAGETPPPARAAGRERRVLHGETGKLRRTDSLGKAAHAVYERARSYPPFRTSLTFGVDGSRVQLLLRRSGSTLYVVALCRPEIAEIVRRALACAGAHLRLRGESIEAAV